MTSSDLFHATLALMHEIGSAPRPADAVLSAWFRAHRDIGARDRGRIIELVQALTRHHARLGWWLDGQKRDGTPRNRLLAWLVLGEGKSASEVQRLTGPNGSVRSASEEKALVVALEGRTVDHPAMPEEVRLECPAWAAGRLRQRFGDSFATEMAALLSPAALDLRVNPIRATRDEVLRQLRDLGIGAEPGALAPSCIRLKERVPLSDLPLLKTGAVEIQDEGSQLVAMLVEARPGERLVDFCAGAGGKTLAIASQMKNKGHVVACDVSEGRLKRAAERFRQAGLHNIQTRLLASESDKWVKRHKGGFDRVLVDAPCSGTGTWRRNPDARWRAQEEQGLEALIALQRRILASAARLVKPGGRLVYATCSLLPDENEEQVHGFLVANPVFRIVPLAHIAPQLSHSAHPVHLSLTPARHDTDGFFAAVMEREAAPAEDSEATS